jgi:hypothetical protein
MLLTDYLYNELCWVSKVSAPRGSYSPKYGRALRWLRVVRESNALVLTASDAYRVHLTRLTVGAESERCEAWFSADAVGAVKGLLKDTSCQRTDVTLQDDSLRLALEEDVLTVSSVKPNNIDVGWLEKLSSALDGLIGETTRARISVKVKGKDLLEECKEALKAYKGKSVRLVLQSSPKLVVDPTFLIDACPNTTALNSSGTLRNQKSTL